MAGEVNQVREAGTKRKGCIVEHCLVLEVLQLQLARLTESVQP
jgi:hypothetical protein